MNHLPIYILALIVLGIIIWHKVNKWLNKRDYHHTGLKSIEVGKHEIPRHPFTIVDSIEEKRLFESRRGKVSFK